MTLCFAHYASLVIIVVFLCALQQKSGVKKLCLVLFVISNFIQVDPFIKCVPFLVFGIQCVVCNSYLDGQLCEPWDQFTFITNCSKYPGIDASKPITCRKIEQVVEHERRVVRQCSNVIDNSGCIDRVGTNDVRIRYCHCTEDLCNSITAFKPQSFYYLCFLSALIFGLTKLLTHT
ncbi:Histone H1B [Schistosoma japonicum]|nr:Histone H1B [Schistosoma japonicum]